MKSPSFVKFVPWAVVGLTAAIFILDWFSPLAAIEWVFYLLPLSLTFWTARRLLPLLVAAVCTLLTILGLFLSPPGVPISLSIRNRAMGVAVFWIVALLLTWRMRMEAALRTAAQGWRTTFDAVSDAVCLLDQDQRIARWNKAVETLFHCEGRDLRGRHCWEVVHGTSEPIPECPIRRMKQSLRREGIELQVGDRWFQIVVDPVRDAAGQLTGAVQIVTDITARKRMEEALRFTQFALDHVSLAVAWMRVDDGRFIYVNDAACRAFGYSREELLGMTMFDVDPEFSPARWAELNWQLKGGGPRTFETIHRARDGRTFPVEVTASVLEIAGTDYHCGFARDITARKRAEAALRESEDLFRSFMNNGPGIAWMKDEEGRHVYLNERYERRFGVRLEDWRGKTDFEVWPRAVAEQFRANDLKVLRSSLPMEIVEETHERDGSVCYWWNFKFPFRDASGRRYVGGFGVDITERKRAEERLRRSEAALRQLAGQLQRVREEERTHIAREIHDVLAQELTRLKMDIAWLTRRLAQPLDVGKQEPLRQKLAGMTELADTAIHAVQRIATELRPVVLDSLGLCAAIEWLAADFQARSGIQCPVVVPAEDVALDPERSTAVFRVLQECLTNVARHAAATRVEVRFQREAGELVLTVQDNGRGIRAEELNDPRSVGLVGMRERALSVGGQFEISGLPGKGTAVQLRVPLPPKAGVEENHP